MNIKELRTILERLQEVFSAAGSRQSARDLKSVAEALDGSEDQTVEEFVAETRSLLEPRPPLHLHPEPTTVPAAMAIARYVRKLLAAGDDRDVFESTLESLRNDKTIGRSELFAIANGFFNEPTGGTHRFRFKSKAAAYAFMRQKFVERAQLENKFKIIEKLTQSR
jgi:hypothetical protein